MSAERFSLFFVPVTGKYVSNKTVQTISELAETVLADSEFFLVDVELKGGNTPVRLVGTVDAEEKGVNMDECARLSNELGFLLDAQRYFRGWLPAQRLLAGTQADRCPTDGSTPKTRGESHASEFRSEEGSCARDGGRAVPSEISDDAISLEKEEGNRLKIPFEQVVETKIIPSI
ncbi:MAG: hypothetical protein U5K31_13850 [Balneolaceae bacterium]|nr:hypothetical protein [Balneolaceae bacterium]